MTTLIINFHLGAHQDPSLTPSLNQNIKNIMMIIIKNIKRRLNKNQVWSTTSYQTPLPQSRKTVVNHNPSKVESNLTPWKLIQMSSRSRKTKWWCLNNKWKRLSLDSPIRKSSVLFWQWLKRSISLRRGWSGEPKGWMSQSRKTDRRGNATTVRRSTWSWTYLSVLVSVSDVTHFRAWFFDTGNLQES